VGDETDIDLVERCRAGDRPAFGALVGYWSEPAMKVAGILAGPEHAREVLRVALLECWEALPGAHSETPFRPWLLGIVARAAIGHESQDESEPRDDRLLTCLDAMDERARIAVVLRVPIGMAAGEIAHALGTNAGSAARIERAAVKHLNECVKENVRSAFKKLPPPPALAGRFFSELSASLADPVVLELRRSVRSGPREAWAVITDPSALPAWVAAEGVHIRGGGSFHAGARIAARGRIADRRASRDDSLVTRLEPPELLAWTTRSRVPPYPDAIEFRWSLSLEPGSDTVTLVHRLHGVAFPGGPAGLVLQRTYARVQESMHVSMHRGLERLASLVEARARTFPV